MKRIIICMLLVSFFAIPQTLANTIHRLIRPAPKIPQMELNVDHPVINVLRVRHNFGSLTKSYTGLTFMLIKGELICVAWIDSVDPSQIVKIIKGEVTQEAWQVWEGRYLAYLMSLAHPLEPLQ